MKPDLLLFTDHYPFGTSEPFLADELPYLSHAFRSIVIVPLDSSMNSLQRSIPENIKVLNPPYKNYKSKILLLYCGIVGCGCIILLFKELLQSKAWRNYQKFLHWLSVSLLIRTYLPVFKKVVKEIETPGKTIIYFYWGQRWSQLLPFITQKFREVAIRMHGSDLYEYLYQDYIPFRKQQLEQADKVFTISEDGKKYLCDRYPEFATKIQVAKLGTSEHGLNPISDKEKPTFTLVSCAGLVKIKRIPYIPEILKHTTLPIQWYHFGDGPEMQNLVRACRDLPYNISFKLMGYVPHEQLIRFYQNIPVDLFLNVSVTEGIPVSIMEAFSFGIPVMATDVGGTRELVNDKNGRLIPKDFSPSETGSLIDALFKSDRLKKMCVAARETWVAFSNATIVYPEFISKLTTGTYKR